MAGGAGVFNPGGVGGLIDADTLDGEDGSWYQQSLNAVQTLRLTAVRYVIPGWYGHLNSTQAVAAGTMVLVPIVVPEATTYDRIGVYVAAAGVAGSLARLGIYEWLNGIPAALVLDAGTVATDAVAGVEIVIAETLGPGLYFLAMVVDNTCSVRGIDTTSAVAPPLAGEITVISSPPRNVLGLVNGRAADVAGGLPDPAPAISSGNSAGYCAVKLREA